MTPTVLYLNVSSRTRWFCSLWCKDNRKEAPLWLHQSLQSWLWPMNWASLARREDFLIPCPAFRCSLICPLYFYLPSPLTPGLSAFTWLLMSFCRGRASAGRQLQLEASSLGIGLAVRPQSLRLFSCLPFLRLVPSLPVYPTPYQTPLELVELHREWGGVKGLLSPEDWL